MTEKDAQLVESLAKADIRNDLVQKIAAAVAASPVLAPGLQKQAIAAPTADLAGAAADVGKFLGGVKSMLPSKGQLADTASTISRWLPYPAGSAMATGDIAGQAIADLGRTGAEASKSLSPLGNSLFKTWLDRKANPSAPPSEGLDKAVSAITGKQPDFNAAVASGSSGLGGLLSRIAGKSTEQAGETGKSVGLDMFKGIPAALNNAASYLTTGGPKPEPGMAQSLMQYLDSNPTLALALGGGALGGASALGAGLYGKKKPRRLIGGTIGGALAGAALGGGLGAIGSSVHNGGRLSDWYKDTKDLFKSKDTAKAVALRDEVLAELEKKHPELTSSYRSAAAAAASNPTQENIDKMIATGRALEVANTTLGDAPPPSATPPEPGWFDSLKKSLGINVKNEHDPGITHETTINTSPWQRATLTGDRNPANPMLALKFGLGSLDLTAAGTNKFLRSMIRNKHLPLSTIAVGRRGFQQFMAERMQSAIDTIRSADAAEQPKLYRQLLGAGDTVSDENIRGTIDALYDRASKIVSGQEKDPSSLLKAVTTGQVAVPSGLAGEIHARMNAARKANPAALDSLLSNNTPGPAVTLTPADWQSMQSAGIGSNANAKLLRDRLDALLQMSPADQAKEIPKLFGTSPVLPHIYTNGRQLNIPLVNAMRDYLAQPHAARTTSDFNFDPSAGVGTSLLKTLNLDQYQPDELKRMGILKADGSLDATRLKAIADHDPSGFARVGVSSADELAKPGVVFDAGYTMPTENVQNAARRAHLDQAPAMSYLLPASWTGQATTTRNPFRLITRGFEWLINSRSPVARIGRLGARGTLPAISVAHGLSNLSQQAQAQKMLDAIQSNPNVPDATKAEMIKQIIAQFPAVDYENKPQAQP